MEEEYPEEPVCWCGLIKTMESCHACLGEGGHHNCGDDTCVCLDKSPNIMCEECGGTGEYPVCPNAEQHHKDEIRAKNRKQHQEDHPEDARTRTFDGGF